MSNILYLSTERNIDLEKTHNIMYLDYSFRVKGVFQKRLYEKIKKFQPDYLIEREFNDGKSKYPDIVTFVRDNIPNCIRAIWLIDNHCNFEWHLEYAPLFDYVFCAISTFVPIMAGHLRNVNSKTKVFWLPLCYPYNTNRIKRHKVNIPYEIVFVGRWGAFFGERTRLLNELQKRYGKDFHAVTDYEDMEKSIREGVISFNRSLNGDMNFRVFESMANGVELVTDDVPDLHLIKSMTKRINIYRSDEELFTICDEIIAGKRENDVMINKVWIKNHHCLVHRHNEILQMIKTNMQEGF